LVAAKAASGELAVLAWHRAFAAAVCWCCGCALTSGAKPVVGGAFLPKPTDVLRVLLRDLVIGKPDDGRWP
jgi:hypothetical protein